MWSISKGYFKAQFTMKVLLEVGLMLIVYSQIYPTLIESPLQTAISSNDGVTAALLSLIPFVIVAVMILGIIGFNAAGSRRV